MPLPWPKYVQSATDISGCDTPVYKIKELKYSEGTLVLDRRVEVRTWELWRLETEEKNTYISFHLFPYLNRYWERWSHQNWRRNKEKEKRKKEKGRKGDREGERRERERERMRTWENESILADKMLLNKILSETNV